MSEHLQTLFATLHEKYQAMVMQVCTGFLKGNRMLAADLTQEVFINCWNALPKFRGDASHKTWIYRITVNTCLQHLRKESRMALVSMDEEAALPAAESAAAGAYNDLYAAIGQLNEVDRLVIMMVLDELDYDEISAIVGISAINLRVKIHRIKSRLKKILSHEH